MSNFCFDAQQSNDTRRHLVEIITNTSFIWRCRISSVLPKIIIQKKRETSIFKVTDVNYYAVQTIQIYNKKNLQKFRYKMVNKMQCFKAKVKALESNCIGNAESSLHKVIQNASTSKITCYRYKASTSVFADHPTSHNMEAPRSDISIEFSTDL